MGRYLVALLICSLFSVVSADQTMESVAGLRWLLKDDRGWTAVYERLGVPGTVKEQDNLYYVEISNDVHVENSTLQMHLATDGLLTIRRFHSVDPTTCVYRATIEAEIPLLLDRTVGVNRTKTIDGIYECGATIKGAWSAEINW